MPSGVDVPVAPEDPMVVNRNQIPRFIPGTTNVQEYTAKMRFLASMWPSTHLDQLAPRAALMVEGTAFRKVARIPPSKLKVNSVDGVAALVAAIGGSWGSTELEERYEYYFEKALYGTIQRPDESHDSFLSRMEANFVELLARDTKLEEVQAYVLLRQSLLNSEDKKKILLEHGGNLRYDPVVKSFRLLGSRFFAELQGSKQQNRSKVYDVNLTENPDSEHVQGSMEVSEKAFHTSADDPEEIDGDFLDALVASEDPDALVVQNFEQELEEFLQEVPGMHDAMTTYLEARQKLVQKKTSRGFWPIKGKSSGKGRGFGFKGKSRGKGRDGFLQRIANSYCRLCNQKGHWKNECPKRSQTLDNGATANLAEMTRADGDPEDILVINEMPDEVVSEDEADETHVFTEARPIDCTESCVSVVSFSDLSCTSVTKFAIHTPCQDAFLVRELLGQTQRNNLQQRISKFIQPKKRQSVLFPSRIRSFPTARHRLDLPSAPAEATATTEPCRAATEVATCFVSSTDRPSLAILDTGASPCVIGENVWKQVLASLPEILQSQIRIHDSQVKFRFGNNQSLTSSFRVQVPLMNQSGKKRLWLSIEVVPGNTPFLFSKRAFKQLGGILNTTDDSCFLQRLNRSIDLSLSKTELYLLDIAQLCLPDHYPPNNSVSESFHVGVTERHESVEHESPDTDHRVSHPIANISSVKTVISSPSIPEFVCNASGSDADHVERNCRDSAESIDPSPSGDDASDRNQPSPGVGRRESSSIRDSSHDEQHDAGAPVSTEPSAGDDESAKPCITFRGCKWTPDWTSFPSSRRDNTSRIEPESSINGDHVPAVMVSVGGRGDLAGRTFGGRSHSELQPPSWSTCSSKSSCDGSAHIINDQSNKYSGDSWNKLGSCRAVTGPQHGRVGTSCDHLGKETSRTDPGYVTWSMARFRTLPPDQQDFGRYCQLMESNNS